MKELQKYLEQSSDRKYYEHRISTLSETEKERLEQLVIKMANAGAKEPFSWAFSEFREGIPQFARFMVLKGLYQSAYDIEGSIGTGNDFDPHIDTVYKEIADAVGEEKLKGFLINYGKGMLYNMLGILDEGNTDYESEDSWQLMEHNRGSDTLGKPVSGLHEDFLEFEQQLSEGIL
ncbi:MAG TPA: hypothetical protein VJ720_09095 [Chitinophaga sp.]|nr:hypothetical protein [Chitinophaga sp.]